MNTVFYKDPNRCISSIIEKIGNKIVIVTPLGLGKPIQLLNAFYCYAKRNPNIHLKILTALTFIKPTATNELAKRLTEPIIKRLYSNYVNLEYEVDRRAQKLPNNVQVIEFYFSPGDYINNNRAQQDYVCSNYTHVIRDILSHEVNVIAQLIANPASDKAKFSLSCNSDLTLDLINIFEKNKPSGQAPLFVGEINQHLPYMYGESAEVSKDKFYAILDNNHSANLFTIPRPAISEQDFMIGLYSSTLIKDNGCLQIGIGSLSDALATNLILRQKNNHEYMKLLENLKIKEKFGNIIDKIGEISTFQYGLFASTELFVDVFLDLYENGILKKKVYDDIALQKLLNEGILATEVSEDTIELLLNHKRISKNITKEDFEFLQYYGIFKDDLQYVDGYIYFAPKNKILADLSSSENKSVIFNKCLGKELKNGRVLHAGFFIGSQELYKYLTSLSESESKKFDMRGIKKINQLYNTEEIDTLQRINARFVNTAMKVTLLGSIISDTLQNGKVIGGVGGQYNFVAMAHELDGAKSIINCRSTYTKNGKVESNIVWKYGETTIPRHLRDLVITEYGIADCRSKTDSEVIKALLNIADSRFQDKLLVQAIKYGKLPQDYQIPARYRNNFPEAILALVNPYRKNNIYKRYPFGSDLTDEEMQLESALQYLNSLPIRRRILCLVKGIFISSSPYKDLLKRMKLDKPYSVKIYIYRCVLVSALYCNVNI